jgi:hypothetical protein
METKPSAKPRQTKFNQPKEIIMLKAISAVVLASGFIAGAANAAETNPLNPSYPTFAANIEFAAPQGTVEIAKNPLTPSFYEWNASAIVDTRVIEFAANNPLQPNYKRS